MSTWMRELAADAFEIRKPAIESAAETVKTEVQKLNTHHNRTVKDKATTDQGMYLPLGSTPVLGATPQMGIATTLPRYNSNRSYEFGGSNGGIGGHSGTSTGRLPKLNFPEFSDDKYRLWISRCENYFYIYDVKHHHWIKIASMYFNDAAARWFQSVEHELRGSLWGIFADMLLDCFGSEKKELLIRQLFHIRQSGSVTDYVECFVELMDQLISYGHVTEPVLGFGSG
jgi:hypothetical protein